MRALLHTKFVRLVMFDIETAGQYPSLEAAPPAYQELWNAFADKQKRRNDVKEYGYEENVSLYPEFGKIICISIGILQYENEVLSLHTKTFQDHDEEAMLREFAGLLDDKLVEYIPAGHNIKGFDIPYLCRRLIINQIPIPHRLDSSGMKPWDYECVDSMDLWRFGRYRSFVGLDLLAQTLGVPSPKTDMSGDQTHGVYWADPGNPNADRISRYCEDDVVAVARVLLKMRGDRMVIQKINHRSRP